MDEQKCNIIKETLQTYDGALGQAINLNKSCITFSPNTSIEMKEFVFLTLNMQPNESFEAYLELTAFIGRNKQRIFYGINEKVWKKIARMKEQIILSWGKINFNQDSVSSYLILHYEYI